MFGGVVRSTLRTADQAAQRGAVDDGAAALLAHLLQLELHAAPYAPQIDGHQAKGFCRQVRTSYCATGDWPGSGYSVQQ